MPTSAQIFTFLSNQGIIKKDKYHFRTKTLGDMPGLILIKENVSNKPQKKIYVKEYREHYDVLYDYVVLSLLKNCGAFAPKVKLKEKELLAASYLFSRDVADQNKKHPEKKYNFDTLSAKSYLVDCENMMVKVDDNLVDDDGNSLTKAYPIDRINLARILLLTHIFRIRELHDDNVGFVLSNENGRLNAKLAYLDFSKLRADVYIPQTTSIKAVIEAYPQNPYTWRLFTQLIKNLNDYDFYEAFSKIEKSFYPACEKMKADIKQSFQPTDKINKMCNTIDEFTENYKALKAYIPEPSVPECVNTNKRSFVS